MHLNTTNLLALYVTEKLGVEVSDAHPSKIAKGEAASFVSLLRWASTQPADPTRVNAVNRRLLCSSFWGDASPLLPVRSTTRV